MTSLRCAQQARDALSLDGAGGGNADFQPNILHHALNTGPGLAPRLFCAARLARSLGTGAAERLGRTWEVHQLQQVLLSSCGTVTLVTQERELDAIQASSAVILDEFSDLAQAVRQVRETLEQLADAGHQGSQLPLAAIDDGETRGLAQRDSAANETKDLDKAWKHRGTRKRWVVRTFQPRDLRPLSI